MPQLIEDKSEKGKNYGILLGIPGFHACIAGLGAPVRGVWNDGTLVYVVGNNTLYQIGIGSYAGGNPSTGACTVLNSYLLDSTSDGNPVFMAGNGTQLFLVANGYAYIDNGSGPVRCQFQISGYVNTNGTDVAWVSGDNFATAAAGDAIAINDTFYTISTVNSPTDITLTGSAGVQQGAMMTAALGSYVTAVWGAYLDGFFIAQRPAGFPIQGVVNTALNQATWVSGALFNLLTVGEGVIIGGVAYLVTHITSPTVMKLYPSPGAHNGLTLDAGVDLGKQFTISAVLDGTSWDPLDFASKIGCPDNLQSIAVDHELLILLGTESMEPWQNTGAALFPFQRIPGAVSREGSMARYAATAIAERVFYLGGSPRGTPVAYRMDGFTPVRISTHAEEYAWALGIDTPSTAIAYGEVHDGHQMWVVNFAGSLGTWVYDETASAQAGEAMWHQRASWTGTAFGSYTPRFHTFIPSWGPAGMHIVAGFAAGNGNLYDQSLNYYDDAGSSQQWQRILPHLYNAGRLQFFGRMTLEMETGGTTSATTQPTVVRGYSDSRGADFAGVTGPGTLPNPVAALMGGSGVKGALTQRVFWPSNGSSRDRVFALAGNNNGVARTCLIDLDLEMELEAE